MSVQIVSLVNTTQLIDGVSLPAYASQIRGELTSDIIEARQLGKLCYNVLSNSSDEPALVSGMTYSSGLLSSYVEGGVTYTVTYDLNNRIDTVVGSNGVIRKAIYNGDGTLASWA